MHCTTRSTLPHARAIATASLFLLGAALFAGACHSRAQTASERLRDAVVGYNDELRFGRQDLAVQRVAGGYRSAFIGGHYRWGRDIQIADVEIVNVEAAGDEGQRATSFVQFRWFLQSNMLVRDTLIRQEWEKHSGQYVLQTERVIDGDPALLEIPEGFRPEASGLEVEADAGVPDAGTAN